MDDRERLVRWMKANRVRPVQLARATGDDRSAISYMTNGKREINEAFRWRFAKAFGFEAAREVFLVDMPDSTPVSELETA